MPYAVHNSVSVYRIASCANHGTVKKCDSHGHRHAHDHSSGPAAKKHVDKPHYQGAQARRLDPLDLNEKCACCQGGVPDGFDEIAGGLGAGHQHGGWLHVPHTGLERGLAAGMGIFGAIGVGVGVVNLRQARATSKALGDSKVGKLAQIDARLKDVDDKLAAVAADVRGPEDKRAAVAKKVARTRRQEQKNLRSTRRTARASKALQRFVIALAGVTTIVAGLLAVAGMLSPPLALAALGVQAAYCAAHITRYVGWDLPRTRGTPRLKAWTQDLPLTQQGQEAFAKRQARRAHVFTKTSGYFAAYGIGAALLVTHVFMPLGPLAWLGSGLLLGGLGAVAYLNNTAIIKTFFHNREARLDRSKLGTKEAQLRCLAGMENQLGALAELQKGFARFRMKRRFRRFEHWFGNPRLHANRYDWEVMRQHVFAFVDHSLRHREAELQEEGTSLTVQAQAFAQQRFPASTEAHAIRTRSDLRAAQRDVAYALQAVQRHARSCLRRTRYTEHTTAKKDLFDVLWLYLSTQKFGVALGDSGLDEMVCRMAAHGTHGDFWQKNDCQGRATLDRVLLHKAARAGDVHARVLIRRFCDETLSYLLHDLPSLTEDYAGALVDHLSDRARAPRAG